MVVSGEIAKSVNSLATLKASVPLASSLVERRKRPNADGPLYLRRPNCVVGLRRFYIPGERCRQFVPVGRGTETQRAVGGIARCMSRAAEATTWAPSFLHRAFGIARDERGHFVAQPAVMSRRMRILPITILRTTESANCTVSHKSFQTGRWAEE